MKIAFYTNTYLPHVGGVANSVESFRLALEALGHRCLVIAPQFKGAEESDDHVLRVQAIKEFNGTDFSLRLPDPWRIAERIREFQPDILHSHHPFLLGDSALRSARTHGLPVVFTHHTLYERYVHYLPFHLEGMERLAAQLATEYANLSDHVIAPSESVARLLRERGVEVPVTAIPTGIEVDRFAEGDRERGRKRHGIPVEAPLIGHVGRLAQEKNLGYLTEAVLACLQRDATAHFLMVGTGELLPELQERVKAHGVADRFHWAGKLRGNELADAYAAMDLFAFASTSETQGMVLAEAMAAGSPVVALDAPGAREVVRDGENGLLLDSPASETRFAEALAEALKRTRQDEGWRRAALATGRRFDRSRCAEQLVGVYEEVGRQTRNRRPLEGGQRGSEFEVITRRVELEWDLLARRVAAFFANLSLHNGENQ